MLAAIGLLGILGAPVQSPPPEPSTAWYRSHLPVTIEVVQDVEAKPEPGPTEPYQRGTLYIGRNLKAFRIRKGQTFQMTRLLGEGGCRIRFQKNEYELGSCRWLSGFSDRESDIYRPVSNK
jgi:hypothetical protein